MGRFPDSTKKGTVMGRSVPRLEDEPLLRGCGRFVDDISFPDQLHMRVVRSAHARGRILRIDAEAARATPGVVAVWTGANIAEVPPIDFRDPAAEVLKPYRQPALAQGYVRYVGEPVAAVFAECPYAAEDAAQVVNVDVEELPPLLSASDPLGDFAPGLSTEPIVLKNSYGDIECAFTAAAHVLELDLYIGRHSGVPLEARGCLARYDPDADVLELYGAAKVPHRTRDNLARILGRPPASVHLKEGHTGGGFGIRGELYPEDVLASLAALKLRRPIKWIEDRREHLMCANHSREQRHCVRAAVDRDGHVLGLDDEFFHDQGAYIRTHGARVPDLTIGMLPGAYRVPAFRATAHFRLTNKTPAATYRAPGRFEGTFVRERVMDSIAAKLNLDPIEVRRRNLIGAEQIPFARGLNALGTDVIYDSGDFALLLDRTLAHVGWNAMLAEIAERRARGELVGAGLAYFVEKTGLGPRDTVHVSIDTSGRIEVLTGGASLGQGFETTMAQIAAEVLSIDYATITVVHGQTNRIADGIGAHASRATVMTGSATHVAAGNLREKILHAAAELLQAPAVALDIRNGEIVRRGDGSGPSISLAKLAELKGGISAEGTFRTDHMTYPFGVHLAQVAIDRDTGEIRIEKFAVSYDIGRAVNPMMIEGQIQGGYAQGLGGSLYEEFRYAPNGAPLSTTFADYLMPTSCEVSRVDTLIVEDAPTPLNPLGLKGAGEAGVTAVGAALASAVEDALQMPGAIHVLPITPQYVLEVLAGRA
jgi:aerobic carbon-monoxide dehydrogenase large subunit